MTDTPLIVEVDEGAGTAWLRLDRPARKNALNGELLGALADAFRTLRDNTAIRCIVTTGSGDSYCAGMDLHELRDKWDRPRRWHERGPLVELLQLVREAPQVTIAAVNGYSLGGGLSLVNAHDIAVAGASASFGLPEIIRGSFGNVATAALYHEGIPRKKAAWMQLTGRRITAPEAERLGLVSIVVSDAELASEARALATEIAGRDGRALEHAKMAALLGGELDLDRAIRVDDLVAHRLRLWRNSFSDVDGYLAGQRAQAEPGLDG